MKKEVTFEILKEKISPGNVLAMAELIAVSETKFLSPAKKVELLSLFTHYIH